MMDCEMGFLCGSGVWQCLSTYDNDPRGAGHWGVFSRRKLVFGRWFRSWPWCSHAHRRRPLAHRLDPWEAPGGGAILSVGIRASSNHGFPPLGSSIRQCADKPAREPNSSVVMLVP